MKKAIKEMLKAADGVAKKQINSLRRMIGERVWVLLLRRDREPDLLVGRLINIGPFDLSLMLEIGALHINYEFVGYSSVIGMVVDAGGSIIYKRPFDFFPKFPEELLLLTKATLGKANAEHFEKMLNAHS